MGWVDEPGYAWDGVGEPGYAWDGLANPDTHGMGWRTRIRMGWVSEPGYAWDGLGNPDTHGMGWRTRIRMIPAGDGWRTRIRRMNRGEELTLLKWHDHGGEHRCDALRTMDQLEELCSCDKRLTAGMLDRLGDLRR